VELKPDEDAEYDEEIVINLDELEPLAAQPHSPDNVAKVKDIVLKFSPNRVFKTLFILFSRLSSLLFLREPILHRRGGHVP